MKIHKMTVLLTNTVNEHVSLTDNCVLSTIVLWLDSDSGKCHRVMATQW